MVRFLAGFAGVADENTARGAFNDFPHGGGERIVVARLNSNQGADQIGRQGGGIAFVKRSPGAIGELSGFPAGQGSGHVKLTHHKLRQHQDMGSVTTPEYSIWRLDPSTTRL